MKVLVAGIGGIGGWMAGALARGGADVSLFARGATLARLQREGLTVVSGEKRETFWTPVIAQADRGQQFDVMILCAKSQDFPALCDSLAPLLQKGTEVIAAVNGLPWWFLAERGMHLESIDPGGQATVRLRDVTPVGAVVHASSHAVEPGVIHAVKADRLILGDVPGHAARHVETLARHFEAGGVKAPVVGNIVEEIWAKLWGNMNMNPLSALTRLSSLPILETPELRALVHDMMTEFDAIGKKLGIALPVSADDRIEITKKLGDFRTSMYADAMARRRLEHEGILGCVVELARKLNVDAPVSRIVYAILKGLDVSFSQPRPS